MTQLYLAEILIHFVFISMIETMFIIVFAKIMMHESLVLKDCILMSIPLAVISQVLLEIGNGNFAYRALIILIIIMVMGIHYKYDNDNLVKLSKNIILAVFMMIVVEIIAFLPFLFIFGEEVGVLTENSFMTVAFSIPTRVFEYIILYVFYLRNGGFKNEKVD